MPSQSERAATFRALHEGPGAFVIPNPYDVGTARILAGLGFAALATSSAGFAFTIGRRDGAITRDQALAHARAVVDATDLPVSADLENGFGDDPATVAETVRLAAEAGLAGCSIEDASGDPQKPIYDRTLAVERVAAAVEAARSLRSPSPHRAGGELPPRPPRPRRHARPPARLRGRRRRRPLAPGLPDLAAIRTVCEAVTRPVNVLAASGGQRLTVEELAAAGVRRISLGAHLSRTALGAFLRAAREIKETGSFGFTVDAAPSVEIGGFMVGRAAGPGR